MAYPAFGCYLGTRWACTMGLSHKNYYYSMRLKKGLNGVFLEWLYTTAAMFTPFLIVPVSLF